MTTYAMMPQSIVLMLVVLIKSRSKAMVMVIWLYWSQEGFYEQETSINSLAR